MTSTPVLSGQRAIVGINLGNAYASIAVINKEGKPHCIANEDGERQIACAISYAGEEVYIGNQAKPHLVKNAQNTILGFRNLLGKKLSDVTSQPNSTSAPTIDINGEPGYTVQILLPAPTPAQGSTPARSGTPATKRGTPAASRRGGTPAISARSTPAPTRPPSPPPSAPKSLTVSEASSIFLSALKRSAEDFLGKPIEGAVISVPSHWDTEQLEALRRAAEAAGISVLQLAAEEGLAVLGAEADGPLESTPTQAKPPHDRTTLVVDMGASTLTLSLLSIKQSLIHPLGYLTVPGVGGDAIDDILVQHFAKEFTKKTKVALSLPAQTPEDQRAEAKLRLAVEFTKRTLSASSGAAACSVESLKDGMDYSGTLNRLRFDVLLATFYARIATEVNKVLNTAAINKESVDEILLVGSSAGLSGLAEKLELFFGENSKVSIRSDLNPSELIAKGAVAQAELLISLPKDSPLHDAFAHANEVVKVIATAKPIGLVFPGSNDNVIPVVLVPSETPLPARRIVRLAVASGATRVGFEVWEGNHGLKELPKPEGVKADAEEEDEEEEPQREAIVTRSEFLGALAVDITPPPATKNKKKAEPVHIEVKVDVSAEGSVSVASRQVKEDNSGNWVSFSI
ncbi:Hsp70 protein-domain-containing protein [Cantharellus anzutake]|uniref:Hsp70 protein-domain-containing protein n=1 Tax=Cantharellus anzutake TaxID=1750568 RepID=UPI0019033A14|nr:Hsp70 protein-domain-containing protein [Cantharellus anzutake]KAF8325431.1 Hsp70 protein-domain-containing protein [Cantharellus anzutake]